MSQEVKTGWKINWEKVLVTAMFFMGAYVRAEKMYLPRTFSLLSFVFFLGYTIYMIVKIRIMRYGGGI